MKIPFEYEVVVSARARSIRVTIYRDGRVKLTVPRRFAGERGVAHAEKFLMQKAPWILKKKSEFEKIPKSELPPLPRANSKEMAGLKLQALNLAEERLTHFNQFYGFKWVKVSIKNQKSRWGSCSRRGNLNFNIRILFVEPHQRDYVVVHELCHLAQLNHSKKFWELVERTVPEYKKIRKGLKLLP